MKRKVEFALLMLLFFGLESSAQTAINFQEQFKLTIKKAGQSLTVKIFIQQILKKFVEDNLRSIHWDDNFMAINQYMPKLNTLFNSGL